MSAADRVDLYTKPMPRRSRRPAAARRSLSVRRRSASPAGLGAGTPATITFARVIPALVVAVRAFRSDEVRSPMRLILRRPSHGLNTTVQLRNRARTDILSIYENASCAFPPPVHRVLGLGAWRFQPPSRSLFEVLPVYCRPYIVVPGNSISDRVGPSWFINPPRLGSRAAARITGARVAARPSRPVLRGASHVNCFSDDRRLRTGGRRVPDEIVAYVATAHRPFRRCRVAVDEDLRAEHPSRKRRIRRPSRRTLERRREIRASRNKLLETASGA